MQLKRNINNNKIKCLFVVGQLGNGGLERQLNYIVKELLNDSKYEVYVYCWNFKETDYYASIFFNLLGSRLLFENSNSSKTKMLCLLKLTYRLKPDKIISFSAFTNIGVFFSNFFSWRSKVYGGLRTSYSFYIKKQGVKGYLNILFPRRIVANSQTAIDEINQNFILKFWKRPTLLNNVIDINSVEKQSINLCDAQIDLSKGINTISIGNVREAKRLDRLIELFNYIKVHQPNFEIRHFHIGGGNIESLENEIKENNLEKYIILLGKQNNVYPFIHQTDIVLHFSDIEGASNVILEAMALGKPVVSTNCGDTKRYIIDDVNGWVVDSFTGETFFEHIEKLFKNKEIYSLMSQSNKESIQRFNITNCKYIFESTFKD